MVPWQIAVDSYKVTGALISLWVTSYSGTRTKLSLGTQVSKYNVEPVVEHRQWKALVEKKLLLGKIYIETIFSSICKKLNKA